MRAVYFETLQRIERGGYDVFSAPHARAASAAGADRAEAMALAGVSAYDVVVVGAGFAGLSAAVRLAQRAARGCSCSRRRAGWAAARRRLPIARPASSSTTASTSCSAATARRLSFLARDRRPRSRPDAAAAARDDDRSRRASPSRLECPALPPPLHLVAGVWDWEALDWRDRLAVLRMAGPLKVAARHARAAEHGLAPPERIAASPGETVESWLVRNGQTPRLREMLWDPLALAALNQPPDTAAAPAFARVLGEMFGPTATAAAIGLPAARCTRCMRSPPAASSNERGCDVRTGATAVVDIAGQAVSGVRSNGQRWDVGTVVSAVPWFAFGELFDGDVAALHAILTHARSMAASPIVTVNLWFDRPILDEPFVGLPGRAMQWVFDEGIGLGRNGLAGLARVERRVAARRPDERRTDCARTRRAASGAPGRPFGDGSSEAR